MTDPVEILDVTTLAKAWGSLTSTRFRFRRRDGEWTEQTREIYDHGDAAAVLLCDTRRAEVILVRQFRFPLYGKEAVPYTLEVCAGMLEGKEPEATARAEAEEETGHHIDRLVPVCAAYASPGSINEKVNLFIGYCDAEAPVGRGGGVTGEGEDIEIVRMRFADALALIGTGGIMDAKTIILLLWAALNGVFAEGA